MRKEITLLYTVIEGNNQTYTLKGDNSPITFKCYGELENFTGIQINEHDVEASNYDSQQASTVVTLKTSYL